MQVHGNVRVHVQNFPPLNLLKSSNYFKKHHVQSIMFNVI